MAKSTEFYDTLFHLHRRRLAGDLTVVSDIARLVYQPLFEALRRRFPLYENPTLDDAVLYEKAGDAILLYGKAPEKAKAFKGAGVFNYLELHAKSRVANYRRDETTRARYEAAFARGEQPRRRGPTATASGGAASPPHTSGKKPVELHRPAVEQGETGVTDGEDDAEERARQWDAVTRGITDPQDRAILDLMRAGERRTERFAEVLGIADLPIVEQRRIVKQHKDRIKVALRRAQAAQRAGESKRPRGRPGRRDPDGNTEGVT